MNRSLFGLLAASLTAYASDDIDANLQKLSTEAAKGYLGPVVSTMGANMNQGWFFEAPKPELWGINIGVHPVFMGTFFASKDETFSTSTTTKIDAQTADLLAEQMVPGLSNSASPAEKTARQAAVESVASALRGRDATITLDGPTAIGSDDDEIMMTVKGPTSVPVGDTTYSLSSKPIPMGISGVGLSGVVPGVPLLVPMQLDLGTLAGTNVALRWFPEVEGFSFFGFGVNHNPGFWAEKAQLPWGINSSVNFAWSKLAWGDFMEFSAWNANVMASKRLGFRFLNIAPFVGFGVESSTLKVSYTTDFEDASGKPIKVSFEDEGDNLLRATVGTKLRLLILDIGASYTFAANQSMAMTAGLGF